MTKLRYQVNSVEALTHLNNYQGNTEPSITGNGHEGVETTKGPKVNCCMTMDSSRLIKRNLYNAAPGTLINNNILLTGEDIVRSNVMMGKSVRGRQKCPTYFMHNDSYAKCLKYNNLFNKYALQQTVKGWCLAEQIGFGISNSRSVAKGTK